jgi:hypothetical protein
MLPLLHIELKGRNTPVGIQEQEAVEVTYRAPASACETTGCSSWPVGTGNDALVTVLL